MKKPTVIDKRTVQLEKISHPDYIPFLGGRPKRVSIISHDDQLNLKIILNTAVSFDDLLKRL